MAQPKKTNPAGPADIINTVHYGVKPQDVEVARAAFDKVMQELNRISELNRELTADAKALAKAGQVLTAKGLPDTASSLGLKQKAAEVLTQKLDTTYEKLAELTKKVTHAQTQVKDATQAVDDAVKPSTPGRRA